MLSGNTMKTGRIEDVLTRLHDIADDPENFADARQMLVQQMLTHTRMQAGINVEWLQRHIDATRVIEGTPLRALARINGMIDDRVEMLESIMQQLSVICHNALECSIAMGCERETLLLQEMEQSINEVLKLCPGRKIEHKKELPDEKPD